MSKIYTKTGDTGKTSLFNGTRVPKYHLRVETYGTIDELNSMIGVVIAQLQDQEIIDQLLVVQKDLLDIGSRLANPDKKTSEAFALYLEERISLLEKEIDRETSQLPPLMQFILPGGGKAGSLLHIARTIARRAERRMVELAEKESVDLLFIKYFNRLSDVFFMVSRFVNHQENEKEIIWTAFEE